MLIRKADKKDLMQILGIYNQGIEDGIATFEEDTKDERYIDNWYQNHQGRYVVLVVENEDRNIMGWASINPYNSRCAYLGVGELSIYIHRDHRGKKLGQFILEALEKEAIKQKFSKLVLFTFPINKLGQGLYRKMNYREVGLFKNQGRLNGKFVDVMIMEKLLYNEEFYLK